MVSFPSRKRAKADPPHWSKLCLREKFHHPHPSKFPIHTSINRNELCPSFPVHYYTFLTGSHSPPLFCPKGLSYWRASFTVAPLLYFHSNTPTREIPLPSFLRVAYILCGRRNRKSYVRTATYTRRSYFHWKCGLDYRIVIYVLLFENYLYMCVDENLSSIDHTKSY